MNLHKQIERLYQHQLATWQFAGDNYAALDKVLVRSISFGDHAIRLQFNPNRIISSAAKVDPKSVSERPCFLCSSNQPKEQTGISYQDKYLLLINPYPIFDRHLTIPTIDHLPQRITGHFRAMLLLAKELSGYTIIYNGPNCGASAPDHFHFQAIRRSMLPVEKDYYSRLSGKILHSLNTEVYFVRDYLRRIISIRGNEEQNIAGVFERVFNILLETLPAADEPMMNIIAWYDSGQWIIHIFPRKQHRPSQYFETGEKQILLSPASIDMGGVLIMPRKTDYEKISREEVTDIFNQVSVDDFFISVLMERLKKEL